MKTKKALAILWFGYCLSVILWMLPWVAWAIIGALLGMVSFFVISVWAINVLIPSMPERREPTTQRPPAPRKGR